MSINRKSYCSIGTPVASLEEACAAIPYLIETEPAARLTTGKAIPNTRALYRSDTGYCLGIHSERFDFVQPCQSLETLEEARKLVRGEWKACCALKGGKKLTASLSLQSLNFAVKVGDTVEVSLVFVDSFDGSGLTACYIVATRLACTNGLMRDTATFQWRNKHVGNLKDRFAIMRGSLQANVLLQVEELKNTCLELQASPFTLEEARGFSEKLFPQVGDKLSPQAEKAREAVLSGFVRGTGNEGKTRWDMLNSVTEWLDWQATYRETEYSRAENRFESLVLGNGAKLRNRAVELLTA